MFLPLRCRTDVRTIDTRSTQRRDDKKGTLAMNEFYHAGQAIQQSLFGPSDVVTPTKVCAGCEQEKPLTEFHKMKSSGDGYRPSCKKCRRDRLINPAPIVQQPLFVFSKICTKCDKEKGIEEFDKASKGTYGYQSHCKQCRSEHNHQFWMDNQEDCRARSRAKDKKPEARAKRIGRHQNRMVNDPQYPEMKRKQRQRHYQRHKEEAKDFYPRRKARMLNATVGKVDYRRILERDGLHCHICGKPIDPNARKKSAESLAFDHIIPLHPRLGEPQGSHSEDNLKPAHLSCNARKGNRRMEDLTHYDRRGPSR